MFRCLIGFGALGLNAWCEFPNWFWWVLGFGVGVVLLGVVILRGVGIIYVSVGF